MDYSGEGQRVRREEGPKTWLEATEEEKEQIRLSGVEVAEHLFMFENLLF